MMNKTASGFFLWWETDNQIGHSMSKYLFQAPAYIYVSNIYSAKNYVSNTILGLKYATLNETVWVSKNLLMRVRAREDNFNN